MIARSLSLALAVALGLLSAVEARPDDKAGFEIFKDKGGEFRWRLKGGDGKLMAVPEDAYKSLASAKSAVESVKKNAASYKATFSTDKAKLHRWELVATNGKVMARPTVGYKTKADAEKAVAAFRAAAKDAPVKEAK